MPMVLGRCSCSWSRKPSTSAVLCATQGLNPHPDAVSDEQALLWATCAPWATPARIWELPKRITVLIISTALPGICTLLCVMLKSPPHSVVYKKSPERIRFVREHYAGRTGGKPERISSRELCCGVAIIMAEPTSYSR